MAKSVSSHSYNSEFNSPSKKRSSESGSNSPGTPRKRILKEDDIQCNWDTSISERLQLPIYSNKDCLIQEIKNNKTLVLIGETGSGKTTQIPQFIYEQKLQGKGMICVTQPRRVAAISIAERVASEMQTSVGNIVGFTVRFENCTSHSTKIKYTTDGMLLQEALTDELLMSYSCIILDEVHERTINNDVLFGIVKAAQKQREKHYPLKVIVMSATMDVDHISNYFDSAPVIYIEGRHFKVTVYNTLYEVEDYFYTTLITIFQVHRKAPAEPNNDILVFLTGQDEIEAMARVVRTVAKYPECANHEIKVCVLYASLNSKTQMEAFKPASKPNVRKIILSTNIAETSVTIKGVKYVIDTGKVKMKSYDSYTGLDMLKICTVSQAQAFQRTGRAGREQAGECYRVYSEKDYKAMRQFTIPEILRTNLSNTCLRLTDMGINSFKFDFIDKPSSQDLEDALSQLKQLGAINIKKMTVTDLGHKLAMLPLDPKYGKILLSAAHYGCVEEILSIISVFSGDSVFVRPEPQNKEEIENKRKAFISPFGDHITILNIYRAFNSAKNKWEWCQNFCFNHHNLLYANKVRSQLLQWCYCFNLNITSCGEDMDPVRKCLLTGLFLNLAQLGKDKKYTTVSCKNRAQIHPSSVLFNTLPDCLLFTEIVDSNQIYMKNITVIDFDWLPDIVPSFYARSTFASIYKNNRQSSSNN